MGGSLTPEQLNFNKSMSSVRQCVEWQFGAIVNTFAFLDFKKNLKLGLQPVGNYYLVGTLFRNILSCLEPNQTACYFEVDPPTVHEY
ncbi:hypothetical protein V1521DRAFT_386580, partial [Lipomyces starkeyi]